MSSVLAAVLAYALTVGLVQASHAAVAALAGVLPSIGGPAVFWSHTALVAVASGTGLLIAVRLLPRALPTAVAVGVMALALAAIAVTLVASGGRVGIELGVWLYDLMPMALGLFFGRAIARDRLRAEVGKGL